MRCQHIKKQAQKLKTLLSGLKAAAKEHPAQAAERLTMKNILSTKKSILGMPKCCHASLILPVFDN